MLLAFKWKVKYKNVKKFQVSYEFLDCVYIVDLTSPYFMNENALDIAILNINAKNVTNWLN